MLPVSIFAAIMIIPALPPTSAYAQRNVIQAQQLQRTDKPAGRGATEEQEPTDEADLTETEINDDVFEATIHHFVATAYSLRGKTASGMPVRRGIVAADPSVLPIGSIIRLHAGEYSGIYLVLDTGSNLRGRRLDIWLPDYDEAIEFGRRQVRVQVLRYGWDPTETEDEDGSG